MKKLAITLITVFLCTAVFASEGEQAGSGEQSIFNGTFADSLWTVVAFLLLLAVLSKFAWKPLLNGLKTREQHIQHQIESAEDARKKAEKLLEDSKQQGLAIVQQATDRAQQHEQEIIEQTRQEILEVKRKAQEDIEHARVAASEQLWEQAGDIMLSLGGEVLGRTITSEDNKRLVRDAIAKIKQ
jgi:F-type H+-transporting ATPase subunit b